MGGTTPNPRPGAPARPGMRITKITFDPAEILYWCSNLWTTHDPTTPIAREQMPEHNIVLPFFTKMMNKKDCEKSKAEVATKIWDKPIVTQIVPATTFYMAEDYHQDYFANNQDAGYCQIVIAPKVLKVREHFVDKLKQ
jgi:peptide-methionine (S)-S-oxide reductase